MTYKELEGYLFSIRDDKFADFSKSLSNSEYISIGVKNPKLKEIIKEHKQDFELNPNDFILGKYLEVDHIYFGLSLIRLNKVKDQLQFLKENVWKAKSWAVTDCMSPYLKKIKFEEYYDFFLKTYDSKYTYERRMAYVLGLKQSKDKNILKVLKLMKTNEEYMVMMAEAWLLSFVALEFEDEVFEFLSTCEDITLKRKAISKICDSLRYTKESKNRFKSLR